MPGRSEQIRLSAFQDPITTICLLLVLLTMCASVGMAGSNTAIVLVYDIFLLMFFALPIFLTKPLRIIKRFSLVKLPDTEFAIKDSVIEVAHSLGLKRIPKIMIASAPDLIEPFVFGTFSRSYLAIPNRFVALHSENVSEFRVAIKHELSHIASKDIWKTELPKYLIVSRALTYLFFSIYGNLARIIWP